MALGGLREVNWWSQSRLQWTLFIKKGKQNPAQSANWHPCWHCQQQGQGCNSHGRSVFQGRCWGAIRKWHGRETAPVPWAVWLPGPLLGLHLTRSAWQELLHTSHLTCATICIPKTPSETGPKSLQSTEEPTIWHLFQVKNTPHVKALDSKTPRKVLI